MMKKLIFLFFCLALLIIPVSAYNLCNNSVINLSVSQITDTSFKLTWNNTLYPSVDIYKDSVLYIPNYTINRTTFTELWGGGVYSVMLVNGTCAFITDVTTDLTTTQEVNYLLNVYLYFFIAIVITVIAVIFRSKLVMILPNFFMLYGFVNAINIQSPYQILVIYALGVGIEIIVLLAV